MIQNYNFKIVKDVDPTRPIPIVPQPPTEYTLGKDRAYEALVSKPNGDDRVRRFRILDERASNTQNLTYSKQVNTYKEDIPTVIQTPWGTMTTSMEINDVYARGSQLKLSGLDQSNIIVEGNHTIYDLDDSAELTIYTDKLIHSNGFDLRSRSYRTYEGSPELISTHSLEEMQAAAVFVPYSNEGSYISYNVSPNRVVTIKTRIENGAIINEAILDDYLENKQYKRVLEFDPSAQDDDDEDPLPGEVLSPSDAMKVLGQLMQGRRTNLSNTEEALIAQVFAFQLNELNNTINIGSSVDLNELSRAFARSIPQASYDLRTVLPLNLVDVLALAQYTPHPPNPGLPGGSPAFAAAALVEKREG